MKEGIGNWGMKCERKKEEERTGWKKNIMSDKEKSTVEEKIEKKKAPKKKFLTVKSNG